MFRLLLLLCAGMFATLLIAGRDQGQMRQGLLAVDEPVKRPVLREAAAAPATKPAQQPATQPATLTNLVPVSAPVSQPVAVVAAPAPVPQPVAVAASPDLPLLYVRNAAINVREGPSTSYPVVGRLARAEAVLVMEPETDGWVRVRIEGDGVEGYVAARLMTDQAPGN